MRILYIGETATHRHYVDGKVPSHWFYGACEMERDGHEVVWAQETKDKLNDLKLLSKYKPDVIFIPNLNIHNHLLLLAIGARIIKTPIYGFLHREPSVKKGLKSKIYKYLLGGVKHLFFLSQRTMYETTQAGIVDEHKCSVPNWGPDMEFYSKVETSDTGWFVSTGKENRDFDILIEAFRITGAPLHIITAKSHNGADYTGLMERCKDIPNIKVTIVDNSSVNYPMMLAEMASARALVCPLRQDKLNYCVGLSTIADAEGLKKPLIITRNPYHDTKRTSVCGYQVTTLEEWIKAISSVSYKRVIHPICNMDAAYHNMKPFMDL